MLHALSPSRWLTGRTHSYSASLHLPIFHPIKESIQFFRYSKQESCAIAKMTARCALYISQFHPNFLHAYVHYFVRIWLRTNLMFGFITVIGCWFWTQPIALWLTSSTLRRMPGINTQYSTSSKLTFKVWTYCTWRPLPNGTPRMSEYTLYF